MCSPRRNKERPPTPPDGASSCHILWEYSSAEELMALNHRVGGSNPSAPTNFYGRVMQLARHIGLKNRDIRNAMGPNPIAATTFDKSMRLPKY